MRLTKFSNKLKGDVNEKKFTGIELPNCNLILMGVGRDVNGNSTVKLQYPNQRVFTIQMNNGELGATYRILKGLTDKEVEALKATELETIGKEVAEYVDEYGSSKQQAALKIYEAKKDYKELAEKIVATLNAKLVDKLGDVSVTLVNAVLKEELK